MEKENYIYILEIKNEEDPELNEFVLCMNKAQVEHQLKSRYYHTEHTTVHEGNFVINHSTKPEIKVYW